MSTLFTTNLPTHGDRSQTYQVNFHDEAYHFVPEGNDKKEFSFRREEDEWHTDDALAPILRSEAIAALDKYLLAQH